MRDTKKDEVVFDFFEREGQAPFQKKERAISWIAVDGKDVEFSFPVPDGHPEVMPYRTALNELAAALDAKRAREYGPKGWVVEYDGKEATVGQCEAAYPAGEQADRPNLVAVAAALRNVKVIRVPHVPWPRQI